MKIAYWICTGIIAWIMGAGSVYALTSPPPAVELFRHLGYPDYFRVMLSVAKILGMAALLVPLAVSCRLGNKLKAQASHL